MTNGHAPEILRRSVTAGDVTDARQNGLLLQFIVPVGSVGGSDLPAYWTRSRDFVLRLSLFKESMWAAAIGKAITKQAALGWKVADVDDSDRRTKRAQELLLGVEAAQGWVPFLSKVLLDFLLTDNGAFVEVVRASSAAGSRILGLMHLDSVRCTRTGDPEFPILFRDLEGREHLMRWHQVLTFADMPNAGASYHGVGMCAASRAYRTIYKLAAMEQYLYEKMSGSGATGLSFIRGLSEQQLTSAIATSEAEQIRKGAVYYRGKILVPVLSDIDLQTVDVALKDLADGFDIKQERDNAYVVYANSIGIAVQDIQPLSGQGLGTGTQTLILDEAAQGQGLAAWRKQFEHALNEWVLPESTTFEFAVNDMRDQKAAADVKQVRAATRQVQVATGEITPEQALQLAVDDKDVPATFLAVDETPAGTLADDEKATESVEQPAAVEAPVVDEDVVPAVTTKAAGAQLLVEALQEFRTTVAAVAAKYTQEAG